MLSIQDGAAHVCSASRFRSSILSVARTTRQPPMSLIRDRSIPFPRAQSLSTIVTILFRRWLGLITRTAPNTGQSPTPTTDSDQIWNASSPHVQCCKYSPVRTPGGTSLSVLVGLFRTAAPRRETDNRRRQPGLVSHWPVPHNASALLTLLTRLR